MPKYQITFECKVTIDALNADEAIRESWLLKNLNNATYRYLGVKQLKETK